MHLIRRAALRVSASSPSASFVAQSRSLTTSSPFVLRSKIQSSISTSVFRRFNSDEAESKSAVESEVPASEGYQRRESAPGQYRNESRFGGVSRPPPKPSSSVYVGNLLFDITAEDLQREFAAYGTIKSAVIASDARGLSKGFGYVEFEGIPEATAAIEAKHQTIFEGRRLVVNFQVPKHAREARENPPSSTLFIGNLAFEMSDSDLNKLFREIRNVTDVRVAIDRRTGQPRGFAHADFVDVESATKGREALSGKEVYGRTLRVDFSAPASSRREPRQQEREGSSSF